jgi:hypothetical protein
LRFSTHSISCSNGQTFIKVRKTSEKFGGGHTRLAINPTHIGALYDKANALGTLGNYKEAITLFDKVFDKFN